MAIDAVFKKIDRYLKKENIDPLVVDIQNKADLDSLMTYYNLPQNSATAFNRCVWAFLRPLM